MAEIQITDNVHANANVTFSDGSPLALAQIRDLNFTNVPVVGDLDKSLDKTSFNCAGFGVSISSPALLLAGSTQLVVTSAAIGSLVICKASQRTLFPSDGFSPDVAVENGECWTGIEIGTSLRGNIAFSADGIGIGIQGTAGATFGKYRLFKAEDGSLPPLRSVLQTILEEYSIPTTVHALRNLPLGIAHTAETSGSVKFRLSYSIPVNVTPLALGRSPVQFQSRSRSPVHFRGWRRNRHERRVHRSYFQAAPDDLVIGVFKKKASTIEVNLELAAGIAGELGTKDVLSAFVGALFPDAKPAEAGFSSDQRDGLEEALQECASSNLAVALNGACAASTTDESAIVYKIDLSSSNASETDNALASALRGDWTSLDSLPNARKLRNICKEIHDRQHKINVNLLGFYNAVSTADYWKSCTVLHDENGQIVLTDEAGANSLKAATTRFRANGEKLRAALAQQFLATVTYAAVTSKQPGPDLNVRQTYDRYSAQMSTSDLKPLIRLGLELQLIPATNWQQQLIAGQRFNHAKFSIGATYNRADAMKLFYSDVTTLLPHTRDEFDRIGRSTMASLIDPLEPQSQARLAALRNDTIWSAMNSVGNRSGFRTIAGLSTVHDIELELIGADWMDIRWWADSMLKVAPKLTRILQLAQGLSTSDLSADKQFAEARKDLQSVLSTVAANTRAGFAQGWGILVMYVLSSKSAFLAMDLGWNGVFQHYESGTKQRSVARIKTCGLFAGAVLVGFGGAIAAYTAPARPFQFAILGDRTGGAVPGVFPEALLEAAADHPEFIVTVGDAIEGGDDLNMDAEWREVLKKVQPYNRYKIFFTPGNHDVWSIASAQAFEKYTKHPLHYSFDYHQAHFTVLDNSRSDELNAEEIAYLRKDLELHRNQPLKFIFSHRPSWILQVVLQNPAFPLHQLALRYGVKYIIAGHIHDLHFELDGVTYLSMASSGGHLRESKTYERGWFFGHTLVTVIGKTARFEIKELSPPYGKGRVSTAADWGVAGLAPTYTHK